jgi:hypothetical protein
MAGTGGTAAGGVTAASFDVGLDWVPPHAAKRKTPRMRMKIDLGEPATGAGTCKCLPLSWFVAFLCFPIDASR